jgi:hypothetical protein
MSIETRRGAMKPRDSLLALGIMSIFFIWGQFYVFSHDSMLLVKAATVVTSDLAEARTPEAVQAVHSRNIEARLSDVRFRAVFDSVGLTLVLIVNFFILSRAIGRVKVDRPQPV